VSMSTTGLEGGPVLDPDDLKMPENPRHRRAIELIAVAAETLLGAEHEVFRDMNWYPTDGRPAVAPDIMVLPADTLSAGAKSYRPASPDDPTPTLVVEVVSDTDTYSSLGAKVRRYRRLGAPCLVIDVAPDSFDIVLHRPGEIGSSSAVDTPIPELGNLVIGFEDTDLVIETGLVAETGARTRVSSIQQLIALDNTRADEANARADEATARATEASARADALAAQLRSLGIEPGA